MKEFDKTFSKSILKVFVDEDKSYEYGDSQESLGFGFKFLYDFGKDPFIKTDYYQKGEAIIYPNDKAIKTVESILKKFGFDSVNYNNTGSIFWCRKYL